jgi:hypothetical protein
MTLKVLSLMKNTPNAVDGALSVLSPKVVAIIGPFRARFFWQRWANVRRAKRMALEVWKLGAVAYLPHAMAGWLWGVIDESIIGPGLLELCRRCDAAILCQGWQRSAGSLDEYRTLCQQGTPVFHTVDDLKGWLAR